MPRRWPAFRCARSPSRGSDRRSVARSELDFGLGDGDIRGQCLLVDQPCRPASNSGPSRSTSPCRRNCATPASPRGQGVLADQVMRLWPRATADFSGLRRAVVHEQHDGNRDRAVPGCGGDVALAFVARLPAGTPSPTNSRADATPNSGAPSAVARRSRITCFAPSFVHHLPACTGSGAVRSLNPATRQPDLGLTSLPSTIAPDASSRVISTTWGSAIAADDGQLHLGARCATRLPITPVADISRVGLSSMARMKSPVRRPARAAGEPSRAEMMQVVLAGQLDADRPRCAAFAEFCHFRRGQPGAVGSSGPHRAVRADLVGLDLLDVVVHDERHDVIEVRAGAGSCRRPARCGSAPPTTTSRMTGTEISMTSRRAKGHEASLRFQPL